MKYDVYSFGVLLLQIISGKRNTCYYGINENLNLLEYVSHLFKPFFHFCVRLIVTLFTYKQAYEQWKNNKGKEFIDQLLDDSSSPCKLLNCMQVALLCVQENAEDRPSMLEVSSMLRNESMANISAPKKPAFSVEGDGKNVQSGSTSGPNTYSFNDQDISLLEPR